ADHKQADQEDAGDWKRADMACADRREPADGDDDRSSAGIDQRDPPKDRARADRGNEGIHVQARDDQAIRDADADPHQEREQVAERQAVVLREAGGQRSREGEDAAHREVEAACDYHEGAGKGHDAHRRPLLKQVEQAVLMDERRLFDADRDEQRQPDEDDPVGLEQPERPIEARGRHDDSAATRRPRSAQLWNISHVGCCPSPLASTTAASASAAATSTSKSRVRIVERVISVPVTSPTFLPLERKTTRSDAATISSNSDETNTIAAPSAASLRIVASTSAFAPTSMPRVGS